MNCNYPVNALEIEQEMLDDLKEDIRIMFNDMKKELLEEIKKELEIKKEKE